MIKSNNYIKQSSILQKQNAHSTCRMQISTKIIEIRQKKPTLTIVKMSTVVVGVDERLVAAVVKEQVDQKNDQKPVKQTVYQNKQVLHEHWTFPKE